MKLLYTITLSIFFIVSCAKNNDAITLNKPNEQKNKIIPPTESKEYPIDSSKTLTSEFNDIKFYTENIMRGKGVVMLSIRKKVTILNQDKTFFGSISFNEKQDSYEIHLPKAVIARELIPDNEFQVFSFDSELPDMNKDFLIIYINQEQKLIKKADMDYHFLPWDDYIKSAFIQLKTHVNDEEQNYWYKVMQISGDSMLIKTVNKESCDYIDDYKEMTKWINWKKDNYLLISLNFCY